MDKDSPRPYLLLAAGLLAAALVIVLASCIHVDGEDADDCDAVGLSAIQAPTSSRPKTDHKLADQPRLAVSKTPAVTAKPTRPAPVVSSTSPATRHRAHGHALDLCDD